MKRDGQQDWADEVLDWDERENFVKSLMKRQFDNIQSFGPKRLMKKRDLDGFDIERLTKRDFDPKRLMKKELWSTRLIRRKEERPGLTSLRVLELPVESEIWE